MLFLENRGVLRIVKVSADAFDKDMLGIIERGRTIIIAKNRGTLLPLAF